MDGEIEVVSGVSWLHDTLKKVTEERIKFLTEAMATGLPFHEYIGFVGRHKEAQRMLKITLPEMFEEFYSAEEESDGELQELDDGED